MGGHIGLYGVDYTVVQQGNGNWYLNFVGGSNEIVFQHLGLDKVEFSNRVLGYYEDGDFPECRSLKDLERMIISLRGVRGQEVITPMAYHPPPKILAVGDKVEVGNVVGEISETHERYYLNLRGKSNNWIYTYLELDEEKYSNEVLGYYIEGVSPYCKTLEDLTRLVNSLKSMFDLKYFDPPKKRIADEYPPSKPDFDRYDSMLKGLSDLMEDKSINKIRFGVIKGSDESSTVIPFKGRDVKIIKQEISGIATTIAKRKRIQFGF